MPAKVSPRPASATAPTPRSFTRRGAGVVLVAALAGCTLPRGAALRSEVLAGAGAPAPAGFAVHRVGRAFLPELASWPATGAAPAHDWIAHRPGPASATIAAGDRLSLVVWDPEENSLLSAPGQKMVDLRAAQVSPEGTIFAPYLGEIAVAGRSPEAARAHIQTYFEQIVPSAQVQLEHQPGRGNSVDLVGGVASPGSVPLTDGRLTVLGLLAQGGGVRANIANPQLRLIRGGRVWRTSLDRLAEDPSLDTTLRGGDKLIVEEDTRRFLALGATGRETEVAFPRDRLSALEAVSLSGGVNDSRANLKGLLVLREYPPEAVVSPDPEGRPQGGPTAPRTVFVLDLTNADGLFSAGRFAIHDGDVILATESAVSNVRTVFGLIGNVFGITNQISND